MSASAALQFSFRVVELVKSFVDCGKHESLDDFRYRLNPSS